MDQTTDHAVRKPGKAEILFVAGGLALAVLACCVITQPSGLLRPWSLGEKSRTSALLRVELPHPIYMNPGESISVDSEKELDRQIKTQMALLRSHQVLERVATDEGLKGVVAGQADWYKWLVSNLQVDRLRDTPLILVSFDIADAETSFKILNVIIRSYMDSLKNQARIDGGYWVKTLRTEAEKLRHELVDERESRIKLAGSNRAVEPDANKRGEYRVYLRKEITRLQLELEAIKIRKARIAARKDAGAIKAQGEVDETSAELEAQIKTLEDAFVQSAKFDWSEPEHSRKIAHIEDSLARIDLLLREAIYSIGRESINVSIVDHVHHRDR